LFCRLSKLLWTCKSRSADETGLRLFHTAFRLRRQNFRDPIINYFNNGSAAAWIRLEHDIGWLDVAMNDAACFRFRQCPRRLFDCFERLRERHWPAAANPRFECFAFHQLHDVETLTVLFAVVTDMRDVRMTNLRGRARFA